MKSLPNSLKPTIGQIVIYHHPGSSDGKYPPQKSPAIVQNVAADGSVRLFVFGPKGQHMDDGIIQGEGPCQWNWPERIWDVTHVNPDHEVRVTLLEWEMDRLTQRRIGKIDGPHTMHPTLI